MRSILDKARLGVDAFLEIDIKFSCLALAAGMAGAGLAFADSQPGTNGPATQPTTQSAAVDYGNTKCPVEGGDVVKGNDVTYEGKIYHFCCDDCPGEFKKDPAKYIKRMEADPEKYGMRKPS